MTPFCTDIDLLHWEPNICRDAAFASQTLMTGTADLSGTTLTISSGSFIDSHIEPDQVVVLAGSTRGKFSNPQCRLRDGPDDQHPLRRPV